MSQEPMSDITSDDKLWAALAWVPFFMPIVSIVILLLEDKKKRPFVKYNAVQSLAAWGTVTLSMMVVVGVCLAPIVFLASFYWAYQAYQGLTVEIPLVTDFVKKQGWV